MTVLLDSNFTGTNGAVWPSPWTTSLQGGTTGGVIDIQSNRGRMRAHDGGYRRARASATGITITNGTYEATFNMQGTVEQYCYLWFRTTGDWVSGSEWLKNGYGVNHWTYTDGTLQQGFALVKVVGGVEIVLVETAPGVVTYTAGADYKTKISVIGSLIKAKVWLASAAEPNAWTLEATDDTYASGGIDISLLSGATANNRQWTLDDVRVTSITPLLNSHFTGTNGAVWPNWTHSFVGGTIGGAVDIQSNRGRLRAHDGSYTRVRADATGASITNGTLEFAFRWGVKQEQYFYLWARTTGGSGGWNTGTEDWARDGFRFYADTTSTRQPQWGIGTEQNKLDIAGTILDWNPVPDTDYRVKIELDGSTYRAKLWTAGSPEPSVWQQTFTDTTFSTGGIATSLLSGPSAGGRQVDIDYIVATDAVMAVPANTSEWTTYLQATTEADTTPASTSQWTAYIQATTANAPVLGGRRIWVVSEEEEIGSGWQNVLSPKVRRDNNWA
jgi:hypothetical protein